MGGKVRNGPIIVFNQSLDHTGWMGLTLRVHSGGCRLRSKCISTKNNRTFSMRLCDIIDLTISNRIQFLCNATMLYRVTGIVNSLNTPLIEHIKLLR